MTILIKGIEMPSKGCKTINIHADGTVYVHGAYPTDLHKAIPIPTPHGRLIDADKLYKWIKAECNPYGKPRIEYEDGNKVLDIIKTTSTVIEAEENK